MKNVITGGCGFIGYNLAEHLLKRGEDVLVLDNLSRRGTNYNLAKLEKLAGDKFEFRHCDVRTDHLILADAVKGADRVYHLAAQVAVTTSVTDPRTDFEINALGTFNVIEAMRQHNRNATLLYSSTNKVYGGMEHIIIKNDGKRYYYADCPEGITENELLDFHSPYGCSKGSAEQYIRDYARIYDLKTVVFRQSCIYGPNQFGIEDQGWVAWFTIAAIYNKPIKIYGDGMQVRDVLHVGDLVNAYLSAIKNIDKTRGKIYNIGGGPANTSNLLELIALLEEKLDKKIPLTFHEWRPGDQPVYISNINKIYETTGWKPAISFDKGINSLIDWAKQNEEVLRLMKLI